MARHRMTDRVYPLLAVCLLLGLVVHMVVYFKLRKSLLQTQVELLTAQNKLTELGQHLETAKAELKEVPQRGVGEVERYVPVDPTLSCETRFGRNSSRMQARTDENRGYSRQILGSVERDMV